jgi:hypothetical protein
MKPQKSSKNVRRFWKERKHWRVLGLKELLYVKLSKIVEWETNQIIKMEKVYVFYKV